MKSWKGATARLIFILERLARTIDFRGREIGRILLVDALKKALQNGELVASLGSGGRWKDEEAIECSR